MKTYTEQELKEYFECLNAIKTYTEQEIKEYFEYLKKIYPNCPFNEAVRQVELAMFDANWNIYTIDKFLKKTS